MNKARKFFSLSLRLFVVSATIILVLGAINSISFAQDTEDVSGGIAETPFQTAMNQATNARRGAGLPTGTVSTSNRASRGGGGAQIQGQGGDIEMVTITAVTTVHFDNPQEAGYGRWPDMVVESNVPAEMTGSVTTGDYTQLYYDAMEEQFPGIWDTYDFGYEPRSYSYIETLSVPASAGSIERWCFTAIAEQ
jgi:hypothetical protein